MASIFGNITYSAKRFICLQSKEFVNQIIHRSCSNSLVSTKNSLQQPKSDWSREQQLDLLDDEDKISVLDPSNENLSDYVKSVGPTFNFAPFVNKSPVLTDMVKLGVNLYKIEKKYGAFHVIMKLDHETEFKKWVTFLSDYVEPDNLGKFLTKNPVIFNESIDDLQTRLNYLESKRFTNDMIKRIVTRNPYWLNFSTKRIDTRLGWFQKQFKLTGDQVRIVVVNEPRLITYNLHHVEVNTFSIREEMGFEENECKRLIITRPRLWLSRNNVLMDRFVFIHKTMKIPHNVILRMPEVLYCRTSRLRQRHTFLEKIGRAQYDFTKPNYVSLTSLISGTDAEFCLNVAKCSVTEYNTYLKSM